MSTCCFLILRKIPCTPSISRISLAIRGLLPTIEVVQLTEECSTTILDPLLEKNEDPGYPTITCSIGALHFTHALCDLGASIKVMSKVVYDKLNHHALAPTTMCLQLADHSVRHLAGIPKDIQVKIRNFFVPVDFVILDMEVNTGIPLILGRPFLSIANAHIDVGAGEIQLNINGQQEKFAFKPKVEQCNQLKEVRRKKKPEKETKKPSLPNIEALIAFVDNLQIQEELRLQEEAKQIKIHNQKNAKCRI